MNRQFLLAVAAVLLAAPVLAVQPVTKDKEGMDDLRRQKTASRDCASDESAIREDGFIRCLKSVQKDVAETKSALAEENLKTVPAQSFTYREAHRRWFDSDLKKPSGTMSLEGMWLLVGEAYRTDPDIGSYDPQGIDHQQATAKVRGRLIFEHPVPPFSGPVMVVHPVALRDTSGHYFQGGSPVGLSADQESAVFRCRHIRIVNLVGASEDWFTYRCKLAGSDELLCKVWLQDRYGYDDLTQYQLFRKIKPE